MARSPAPTAPPNERDYLVIFEEPDDTGLPVDDDALILDIEQGKAGTLGEIDVQQQLDLELRNDINRWGTVGFVTCVLGAAIGIVLMVLFAMNFPDGYYEGRRIDTEFVRPMMAAGLTSFLLMLVGTITVHYGRRIQARGNLTAVRIVEKASTPRAGFEE